MNFEVFIWTEGCEKSFQKLKSILVSSPVFQAPAFDKQFKLAVDASDVGCGAMLFQEGLDGFDHPVCFTQKV